MKTKLFFKLKYEKKKDDKKKKDDIVEKMRKCTPPPPPLAATKYDVTSCHFSIITIYVIQIIET